MKKAITLILLASMLLSVSACGSENAPGEVTTGGDVTTAENGGESTEAGSRDAVPSAITKNMNFKGETVTFLTRDTDEFINEIKADEETGDTVNDAIYARNMIVEDKLRVKIEVVSRAGSYGPHTQFNSDVVKEVMAGDTPYDVISYYAYAMPMIASE